MSKGQETRQQIIKLAAPIFNQRGYRGSSISEVMKITGLQKGGIYRHFGSKEELALAAFDFAQQQSTQRLEEAVQAEINAVRQLLAFVRAFHGLTLQPPIAGGCPILNTVVDSDDGDAALRERVRTVVTQWEAMLKTAVQQGILAGEIRADAEPQAVAAILISTIEGAILLSRAHGKQPIYMQYAVDHLVHFIERDVAA